jgi:hypothetical protein
MTSSTANENFQFEIRKAKDELEAVFKDGTITKHTASELAFDFIAVIGKLSDENLSKTPEYKKQLERYATLIHGLLQTKTSEEIATKALKMSKISACVSLISAVAAIASVIVAILALSKK